MTVIIIILIIGLIVLFGYRKSLDEMPKPVYQLRSDGIYLFQYKGKGGSGELVEITCIIIFLDGMHFFMDSINEIIPINQPFINEITTAMKEIEMTDSKIGTFIKTDNRIKATATDSNTTTHFDGVLGNDVLYFNIDLEFFDYISTGMSIKRVFNDARFQFKPYKAV